MKRRTSPARSPFLTAEAYRAPLGARITCGECADLVAIVQFLCARFSAPVADHLGKAALFPPPKMPSNLPSVANQVALIHHALRCTSAMDDAFSPSMTAKDFMEAGANVVRRISFILNLIKVFVSTHNRLVSYLTSGGQDATPQSGTRTPDAKHDYDEADLPALRPTRAIAEEYFNKDEIELYREQLQCALRRGLAGPLGL